MKGCGEEPKLFKGRYAIFFYDGNDEHVVTFFNNIKEICDYKNKPFTKQNYNLIKVELYRALKRCDHKTWMLDGKPMRVYLIDIKQEEIES